MDFSFSTFTLWTFTLAYKLHPQNRCIEQLHGIWKATAQWACIGCRITTLINLTSFCPFFQSKPWKLKVWTTSRAWKSKWQEYRVNISSMVRFLSLSFKLYGPLYSYRNFFLQGSNGTQTCPEDSGDRKGKRPLGRRQDVCTRGKYCVIKRDQRVEEKCLY